MNMRMAVPIVRAALVAVVALASIDCGGSPITSRRIEGAIEPTFANLVQLQASRLGLPPVSARDFDVAASCRRVSGGRSGTGDWICALVWFGPDHQRLKDVFDISVATNGCYTATAEGNSLGGPALKGPDGHDMRNLLFAFDGCFDTTSAGAEMSLSSR